MAVPSIGAPRLAVTVTVTGAETGPVTVAVAAHDRRRLADAVALGGGQGRASGCCGRAR